MKKNVRLLLFALLAIPAIYQACTKKEYETYTFEANVPIYMSFQEFRSAVKSAETRGIEYPGKIYFKDNLLFINEVNEGIHVINNADPSNPVPLTFYEIPGNVDIAIRGNILFADSFIDLVAIDISDIFDPVEAGRLENAFPNTLPPIEQPRPISGYDPELGVVVGWQTKIVTERFPTNSWGWGGPWMFRASADMALQSSGPPVAGVAGSMARFMLHEHYLYSVANPFMLKTLDISVPEGITAVDSISTWRNMETLFRHDEHLFIGTTTGMLIYSLANPAKPEFVSDFDHVNSCDPVVVANDIAYVTLRSGNNCGGTANQLDVIDIIDIKNPRLLKSYPMFNPHGLGIDHPVLFICDGADGLKIYDATNPLAISSNMIAHFPDIDTYDVIPLGNVLMMIGHDGLFQYDYSDLGDIRLLSHIRVTGEK
ncbi:MAG: hypothetical protein EA408_10400 [Marinilabiliales bacterium]|nr:MAG: hypothetical protein EA408_10400 [Marinilabiliales bacterium]